MATGLLHLSVGRFRFIADVQVYASHVDCGHVTRQQLGRGSPVHPMEPIVSENSVVKLRVSERVKSEWREHANQNGIRLSDFVRTACRLSALVGHHRLTEGLSEIAGIRRDLHAIGADLRRIADDNPHLPADEIRSALTRIYIAADAITNSIHPGGSKC